ncbi:MAG: CHAT domain-containing protein [Bacteroidetes bacterium]|nr:CHAT domain-containing protein [Bacteroidota bacterium]
MYSQSLHPDSALAPARKVLAALHAGIRGGDHPYRIFACGLLGTLLMRMDSADAAEPYLQDALAIARRMYSNRDHPAIASLAVALASDHVLQDRYNDAEPLLVEALAMYRRIYEPVCRETANCATYLAKLYERLGRLPQSESLYVEAVASYRQLYSSDNPDLATSIDGLGDVLVQSGRSPQALPLLLEGLMMRKRLYPQGHRDVVTSILNLARCTEGLARWDEAEQLYMDALDACRHISEDDTPDLSNVLSSTAAFQMNRGCYADAEPLMVEAIQMNRRVSRGRENSAVASSLADLAGLYSVTSRFDRAEKLYFEAIRIYKRVAAGKATIEIATCYENLAGVYTGVGRHQEAERYLVEGVGMLRTVLHGQITRDLAQGIANLGVYYTRRGRFEEAEPLLSGALNMMRNIYRDSDHLDVASILSDCAVVEFRLHGPAYSLPAVAAALGIYRRLFGGRDHPDLAYATGNLAHNYTQLGCVEEAEPLFIDAIAMWRRIFKGEDSPEIAAYIDNLGRLYYETARYDEALSRFEESLAIRRRLGRNEGHVDIVSNLFHVAAAQARRNNLDSAVNYCAELEHSLIDKVDYSGLFESEDGQMAIERDNVAARDGLIQLSIRYGDNYSDFYRHAANILLNTKGRILDNAARRRMLIDGNDGAAVDLWRNYCRFSDSVALQYEDVPSDSIMHLQWARRVSYLDHATREAERQFLDHEGRTNKPTSFTQWTDVARALQGNEAAVEIARIQRDDRVARSDSAMYCALILRHADTVPVVIRLCDYRAVANCLKYPVGQASEDGGSYVHDACTQRMLFDSVWTPIQTYLHGIHRIYLSPDDYLNRVSFGILGDSTGRKLQDRYEIRYVTGLRDLPLPGRSGAQGRGRTAAVVGNPLFSADSAAIASLLRHNRASDSHDSRRARDSGSTDTELPHRSANVGQPLAQLGGTMDEIGSVARMLRRHGYLVTRWIGIHACEENFDRLSSPAILHIATHGFTFDPPRTSREGGMILLSHGGAHGIQAADNPYLRTGILLAGADHAWTGHQPYIGIRDGIVTAFDIAHMDFTGTELVALSACETGLGDILGGEGVFGLARAFRAAGARAVMMSLWKVPDKQTQELMELFYTNWLDRHMSKPEALNAAQREMAKRYDDPYYWGAFVLVGE